MTLLAQRNYMLRHAIGLAPLIAVVAPVDRAEAACNPASPVNNVTCTGTTANANGTTGYGTNSDTGNTYSILSGASVMGTGIAGAACGASLAAVLASDPAVGLGTVTALTSLLALVLHGRKGRLA